MGGFRVRMDARSQNMRQGRQVTKKVCMMIRSCSKDERMKDGRTMAAI